MNKLFIRLLCCLGLFVFFAAPVQASESENRCGANLTWELYGGDLYIYGTGPMDDYSEENLPPWYDQYYSYVYLDEGVTHIGDRAFADSSVRDVGAPESLCSIGMDAFANTPLFNWGSDLVYVGNVLYGCPYACPEVLEIQEGTVGIADGAFLYQYDIMELIVPDSVFRIGADAFTGTQWYENQPEGLVYCGKVLYADKGGYSSYVTLEDGTTGIADCAFRDSYNLSSITLPDGLMAIGDYAFSSCTGLYSVSLGSYGLQSIGRSAFENCTQIFYLYLPEGLTEIGAAAFRGSSTQVVSLPYSVLSIGPNAYENCQLLTNVDGRGDLQAIGDAAFKNCKLLRDVLLGWDIRYIGQEAFADYYDRWWPFDNFRDPIIIQFDSDAPYIGSNAFANVTVLGLYQPNAQGFETTDGWGGRVTWKENPRSWSQYLICGTTSSTVSWAILDDHTLCIFGSGDMYPGNYTPAMDDCPFAEYTSVITEVCVEPGVTSLGDYAFTNLSNLASISLPADLEIFGTDCFKGTAWLNNQPEGLVCLGRVAYCIKGNIEANVVIPEGIRVIGNKLFADRTELVSITFPSTLRAIGKYAFEDCTSLASLSLPQSVTEIRDGAFSGCTALTSVSLPDSVTTLGTSAFGRCTALTDFDTGNGITAIATFAFINCTSLQNIHFGSQVSSIGRQAFQSCTALTELTVPDGVTYIAENAFSSCTGLVSVDLNQVRSMYFGVFSSCTALKTVIFSPFLETIPGTTFSGCTALTEITIPDTVKTLGENCFSGCTALTQVRIGAGVQTVQVKPFKGCTSLTRITVAPENPWLDVDDAGVLYTEGLAELIDYPAGRTGSYCMPEGVSLIRERAFINCSALTGITFPNSLRTIKISAFRDCTGLTQVVIPDGVTVIEESAFWGCTGIRYALLGSGLNKVYYSLFRDCTALKQVHIKNGPTAILSNAFYGCDSLESVVIPDSVTEVQQYAFASCDTLKSVYLGSGVQTLGYATFSGSSRLANIHIPQSLTRVDGSAFSVTGLKRGHVSYAGTQTQWNSIQVSSNNDILKAPGTIHYGADQSYQEDGHQWSWLCTGCDGYAFSQQVTEPAVTVCAAGQTLGSYIQLSQALKNCDTGAYMVLQEDMASYLSLDRDLYIDLNGHSLTGSLDANGFAIYGMDSTTDGYTCENMGRFSCVDEDGKAIVPVSHFKSDLTGSAKRYMAISTDSGYTFHRFYLGITKLSIRPGDTGFGYKAKVCGDKMVMSQLEGFGFRLNLAGNDTVVTKTITSPEMGREYSLLLKNFQIRQFGETPVNAEVFLTLKDGTEIVSSPVSYSMKTMLQMVCTMLSDFESSQIQALKDMCQPYRSVMKDWGVDALVND